MVIPVFNEEDNLLELGERLVRTLTGMGRPFEIIFVDDGSTDGSWELLTDLNDQYPQQIRALQFHRNFGQHQAIFAGFQAARGQVMVTLDADLQNPPEEIPRLVAKLDEGYDTVGGWRENRQDSIFRRLPSQLVNTVMSRVTGVKLRDYGCMLRAYRRSVVDSINQCQESSSFIPALANLFSQRVAEIPVGHAERERGKSKYGLVKLLRLNFDLMTGFSNLPIHLVGFMGVTIAFLGLLFGFMLIVRADLRGAGSGRGLHPVRHPVRLRRSQYLGVGPDWRIRRPHLPGSPGPPPLRHPQDPGPRVIKQLFPFPSGKIRYNEERKTGLVTAAWVPGPRQ